MPSIGSWLIPALALFWGTALAELADPTRPALEQPADVATDTPLPRVSAIFIGRGGRHALFNGKAVVRVGDHWSGLEVLAIEPGRVRVRRGDQLTDLPLVSNVKKTNRKVR